MNKPLWVVRSRPVESGSKGLGLEFYLTNGLKFSDVDGFSYARVAINRKKATTKENREKPLPQAIVDALEQGEQAASILNHLEDTEDRVREAEMHDKRTELAKMFPGAVSME